MTGRSSASSGSPPSTVMIACVPSVMPAVKSPRWKAGAMTRLMITEDCASVRRSSSP